MKKVKPAKLLSMDTPSVECEIPQYTCLQDAKTDLVLDQLVEMIHEIKGEIADLKDIIGWLTVDHDGKKFAIIQRMLRDDIAALSQLCDYCNGLVEPLAQVQPVQHEHDHVCSSKCPPWNKHGKD